MPGLPMFGHGQIEGYSERYGMEYRRSYHDEIRTPGSWRDMSGDLSVAPSPGPVCGGAESLLYDFYTNDGCVNEEMFAYSNPLGRSVPGSITTIAMRGRRDGSGSRASMPRSGPTAAATCGKRRWANRFH